ncbi:hypothetical protein LTS01_025887, partial [Friedmanniomyces endolithicus]
RGPVLRCAAQCALGHLRDQQSLLPTAHRREARLLRFLPSLDGSNGRHCARHPHQISSSNGVQHRAVLPRRPSTGALAVLHLLLNQLHQHLRHGRCVPDDGGTHEDDLAGYGAVRRARPGDRGLHGLHDP